MRRNARAGVTDPIRARKAPMRSINVGQGPRWKGEDRDPKGRRQGACVGSVRLGSRCLKGIRSPSGRSHPSGAGRAPATIFFCSPCTATSATVQPNSAPDSTFTRSSLWQSHWNRRDKALEGSAPAGRAAAGSSKRKSASRPIATIEKSGLLKLEPKRLADLTARIKTLGFEGKSKSGSRPESSPPRRRRGTRRGRGSRAISPRRR